MEPHSKSVVSAPEKRVAASLQKFSEDALVLSHAQEAGQAQTPLCDAFERLQNGFHGEPVHAILLGFSPENTAAAVSALVGDDYNICRVIVPSRIGYTEVLLQERGFSVESGGQRHDFDQMEPFIKALEKEDLLQEGNPANWMDPLRLQLPAPSRRRGLRLLIPESLDALVKKPALLSTLADQADWLFLCGQHDGSIDTTSRDTLQLLIDQMVGLQCLISNKETVAMPAHGWWTGWKVVCSLSPLQLNQPSDAVDARLALLTQPGSELRRFIQESRRQRGLESNAELLLSEIEQMRKHLENQKKLQLSGLVAGANQDQTLRRAVDLAKQRMQEDVDAVRRSLEDESKRQLVPGGLAYEALEVAAEQIEIEDILQSISGDVIRLSLDDDCRARLAEDIQKLGRLRLSSDLAMIQESLDVVSGQMQKDLKASASMSFRPSFTTIDEQQVWTGMMGLARPEIRYRGEMPKPTILSRLGKARQGIMGLLMLGMIFGSVGSLMGEQSNIRTYLYAAMLPLIVIGFFYTYISVRKQQQVLLTKELDKLREGAARELRRVVSDLFREEQNVVSQHLQKLGRTLGSDIGEQVQKLEAHKLGEREKSTRQAKEQERSISQRLKKLEDRQRKASSLSAGVPKLQAELTSWLNDWVTRFNKR